MDFGNMLKNMTFEGIGSGQEKTFDEPGDPFGQILGVIQAGIGQYEKTEQKRIKRDEEKTNLYITLRKAEYSPEQAAKVVEERYGTPFEPVPEYQSSLDKLEEQKERLGIQKQKKELGEWESPEEKRVKKKQVALDTFEEKLKIKQQYESKEDKEKYLSKLPPESREKTKITEKRRFRKDIVTKAEVNEQTWHIWKGIKTKEDLENLIERREYYESKGVNVRRILNFWYPEDEED